MRKAIREFFGLTPRHVTAILAPLQSMREELDDRMDYLMKEREDLAVALAENAAEAIVADRLAAKLTSFMVG
jgi:hypothetical protein